LTRRRRRSKIFELLINCANMPNEPTPIERTNFLISKIGEVVSIKQQITQKYDPLEKKIITYEEPSKQIISLWSDRKETVFIAGETQNDQQVISAIKASRIAQQNWQLMTPEQQQQEVEKYNRFIEDPYHNPIPNPNIISICSQQLLQSQYKQRLQEIQKEKG